MDNDDQDQQQQEAAPEVEPEDPRTTLKQETITEGLQLIQRTTGKNSFYLTVNRRNILCVQHT